jgi:hypothetical protein
LIGEEGARLLREKVDQAAAAVLGENQRQLAVCGRFKSLSFLFLVNLGIKTKGDTD